MLPTKLHFYHGLLGVSIEHILEGNQAAAPPRRVAAAELAAAVRAAVDTGGAGVDGWGERVGWDVSPLLGDPERLWAEYTPDALRDICAAVGIDWRAALPV